MTTFSRQEAFADNCWEALRHDTTRFAFLPGKFNLDGSRPTPAANVLTLDGGPIPAFDRVPGADTFMGQFNRAPHAIIRIGHVGLVAVVETERDFTRTEGQIVHSVVPLTEEGPLEAMATVASNKPALILGRLIIARAFGFGDDEDHWASRRHAALEMIDNGLVLSDLYSVNGTRVALEYRSGPTVLDDRYMHDELDAEIANLFVGA